ncbi:hypothetical protein ACFSVK_06435 [Azorhizophilus paspali]|uniref:OB-fold protein n=1 Tax=Azorhizophilus paspali TaxID=69963 RepID=UPI00362727AC
MDRNRLLCAYCYWSCNTRTANPEERAAFDAEQAQQKAQRAEERRKAEIAEREAEAARREAKIAAERQAIADMPLISAHTLASAYHENTVAADAQFKGKRFKVTGVVTDINTDFMGDPYLVLRGGINQFMEPKFEFDKSDLESLANLKKGHKVVLLCTGRGDVAKIPVSDDCSLL